MRPKIFDLLFNDDRQFVMEICRVKFNSMDKWAIITRRNVSDYPPIRTDHFESREAALSYYMKVVPNTPLVSLGNKSPDPPINLEQYKEWLRFKGLKDEYLGV